MKMDHKRSVGVHPGHIAARGFNLGWAGIADCIGKANHVRAGREGFFGKLQHIARQNFARNSAAKCHGDSDIHDLAGRQRIALRASLPHKFQRLFA